ncbi:MAG: YceI family protein [Actinomycetota bacterium]|nr:YceI family protein [Actinomycetota bacterium]
MDTTTQALDGTFTADPIHSSLQFSLRHMGVSMFRASFDDLDARVVADDQGLRLEGSVKAESISIKQPPEFREHVLYGADFLDANTHPDITFRSADVRLGDDGTVSGAGELTIKGITKPITATGTYRAPIEDPFGSERAALEITATVDRREWAMDWQAPLPKGGDALGYDVQLTAHIELVRDGES